MKKSIIKSIDKALDIIECFATSQNGLRISTISKKLNLPISTTHRLLDTLVARNYVRQDIETKKYCLGLEILRLQGVLLREMDLVSKALPHLTRLLSECNETVHLAVLDQGEVVYIQTLASSHSLAMYTPIGKRNPVHCTALGKILLSGLSVEEVKKIVKDKDLIRFTPNTIVSFDVLMEEIQRIRSSDLTVDNEELSTGIKCIAGPLKNHEGKIIAAVSISGPVMRMTPEKDKELLEKVRVACQNISRDIGFSDASGYSSESDRGSI